jgi:asparagine synthase (glutamine-hydrolysing)
MSGVVALLDYGGAPFDTKLLQAMTAAQRFRGPDGEGTWQEGPIGLGHTLSTHGAGKG